MPTSLKYDNAVKYCRDSALFDEACQGGFSMMFISIDTTQNVRPLQIDYLVDGFAKEISMICISTYLHNIVGFLLFTRRQANNMEVKPPLNFTCADMDMVV